MGYSLNVVSKGDIVIINGVRFCVKYDFNLAEGHKNLWLKRIGDKPKEYEARVEEH